jgi:selenide,water dikinase
MVEQRVRLTELTACAGCAGKAGAEAVSRVVSHLSGLDTGFSADLLVGLSAPDDAAVYRLNKEQAAVVTVDFFAPLVDDPYDYGAIAATNAMSDVYAMGGEVLLAVNVAAFPEEMDPGIVGAILQGGADKVREAGAMIAGGHTIIDDEPKYGLCALGLVHPEKILTKAGAQPGDHLYLTKAIGTGIITTAAKNDRAALEHLQAAVDSMTLLNRRPLLLARDAGARCLTDVTGYSLLGHGYEVAAASGVRLRIDSASVPLLPGALEYAAEGIVTGGAARNRAYLAGKVDVSDGVSGALEQVLFDPQTSGGLLFAVSPNPGLNIEQQFEAAGLGAWRIGEVVEGAGVEVV